MTTKTLKLGDDLAHAVKTVGRTEHIEESGAIRKLIGMGFQAYIARLYGQGHIGLRDAARQMKCSLSETVDVLQQFGVKGNITAADTLESLRCLSNARITHHGTQ